MLGAAAFRSVSKRSDATTTDGGGTRNASEEATVDEDVFRSVSADHKKAAVMSAAPFLGVGPRNPYDALGPALTARMAPTGGAPLVGRVVRPLIRDSDFTKDSDSDSDSGLASETDARLFVSASAASRAPVKTNAPPTRGAPAAPLPQTPPRADDAYFGRSQTPPWNANLAGAVAAQRAPVVVAAVPALRSPLQPKGETPKRSESPTVANHAASLPLRKSPSTDSVGVFDNMPLATTSAFESRMIPPNSQRAAVAEAFASLSVQSTNSTPIVGLPPPPASAPKRRTSSRPPTPPTSRATGSSRQSTPVHYFDPHAPSPQHIPLPSVSLLPTSAHSSIAAPVAAGRRASPANISAISLQSYAQTPIRVEGLGEPSQPQSTIAQRGYQEAVGDRTREAVPLNLEPVAYPRYDEAREQPLLHHVLATRDAAVVSANVPPGPMVSASPQRPIISTQQPPLQAMPVELKATSPPSADPPISTASPSPRLTLRHVLQATELHPASKQSTPASTIPVQTKISNGPKKPRDSGPASAHIGALSSAQPKPLLHSAPVAAIALSGSKASPPSTAARRPQQRGEERSRKSPSPPAVPSQRPVKLNQDAPSNGVVPFVTGHERLRSAEKLAQLGVLNTAPQETLGECPCAAHDAHEALVESDWIRRFLEYSRQWRSEDRLLDLQAVPFSGNVSSSSKPSDGVWCSVDPIGNRRSDVLPPRRFVVVSKSLPPSTSASLQAAAKMTVPCAAELLLFPDEAFDPVSGTVASIPVASFPLTARSLLPHAAASGTAPKNENHPVRTTAAISAVSLGVMHGAVSCTRVRLCSKKKHHFIIEVVAIAIAPLEAETARVLNLAHRFKGGSDSLPFESSSDFRTGPPLHNNLLSSVMAFLTDRRISSASDSGTVNSTAQAPGDDVGLPSFATIIGGATIGVLDPQYFVELLRCCVEISNASRLWAAEQLDAIFGRNMATFVAREAAVGEMFEKIRNPLVANEYRIPMSLWVSTVEKVARLAENKHATPGLQLPAALTLDQLTFQEGHRPLAYDAFGHMRGAVHRTSRVLYDVRCLPMTKTRLVFPRSAAADGFASIAVAEREARDGDAALVLEYVSRFPFIQRTHAVLSDGSKFYIVLPPLLSHQAIAASRGSTAALSPLTVAGTAHEKAAVGATYLSLGELCRQSTTHTNPDLHFEFIRKIAAQCILGVGLLHSRGVVAGNISPRTLVCKVVNPHGPKSSVEVFLSGVGLNTVASSWLRQQKGAVEYVSPAALSFFLDDIEDDELGRIRKGVRSASVGAADDWWALGCSLFEVFTGGQLLFPLPEGDNKRAFVQQWAELLLPGGLDVENVLTDDLLDYARANVEDHVTNSVTRFVDELKQDWAIRLGSAKGASPSMKGAHGSATTPIAQNRKKNNAPSTASAGVAAIASNLAARRIEERKASAANVSNDGKLRDGMHQTAASWQRRVTEFLDVLHYLLDARQFSCADTDGNGLVGSLVSPCPSGFHGRLTRLMMMPFFKDCDWVALFEQAGESLTLNGGVMYAPHRERGRSTSSESRPGKSARNRSGTPPNQQPGRRASIPLTSPATAHRNQTATTSAAARGRGVTTKCESPIKSSASVAASGAPIPAVNPFLQYDPREALALVQALGDFVGDSDRALAEEARRAVGQREPAKWSAEAVPHLTQPTSFLRPTASFQCYRRAVEQHHQLRAGERYEVPDPADDTVSSVAGGAGSAAGGFASMMSHLQSVTAASIASNNNHAMSNAVVGGDAKKLSSAALQRQPQQLAPPATVRTISPLHHSYPFQRPKGLMDLVSEKKPGAIFDPAPEAGSGDVKSFSQPLMSTHSKRLTKHRHQGYLELLPERGNGTYEKSDPSIIEPLPPSETTVKGQPRVIVERRSIPSRGQKHQVHDGDEDAAGDDGALPTSASPRAVQPVTAASVTTPTASPSLHASATAIGAVTVSPDTPASSLDPAMVLFASPVADDVQTTSQLSASNTSQRSRKGRTAAPHPSDTDGYDERPTPAARPAMRLPPRSSDRSSEVASRSSSSASTSRRSTRTGATNTNGEESPPDITSPSRRVPRKNLPQKLPGPATKPPTAPTLISDGALAIAPPPLVASIRRDGSQSLVTKTEALLPSKETLSRPKPPSEVALGHWERSESDDDERRGQGHGRKVRRGHSDGIGGNRLATSLSSRGGAATTAVGGTVRRKDVPSPASLPPPQRHFLEDYDDDDESFV